MTGIKIVQEAKSAVTTSYIKSILAVAAGKGGVGKSTVSVNLALALREQGFKVGLLDADVYGPSIQQMLPVGMEPVEDPENPERLLPALAFGISVISVAHFRRGAAIVRAPIANQIIEHFLTVVDWGELDYLILDLPPGTGDIQLTLMQKAKITAAIVVTTPQIVATIDVRKAIQLFQRMEIPVLGVVENMSFFEREGEKFFPFGEGGGEELAKDFSIPLLCQIPIDPKISEMGDKGESLLEKARDSTSAQVFLELAKRVAKEEKGIHKEEISVRQTDPGQLEFFIEDVWHRLDISEIQKHCPCAKCSKISYEKKTSASTVSLLEFSFVGRYALKLKFTSGCIQGIYPFSLLKKLIV